MGHCERGTAAIEQRSKIGSRKEKARALSDVTARALNTNQATLTNAIEGRKEGRNGAIEEGRDAEVEAEV